MTPDLALSALQVLTEAEKRLKKRERAEGSKAG
jgi:hypothetical protein